MAPCRMKTASSTQVEHSVNQRASKTSENEKGEETSTRQQAPSYQVLDESDGRRTSDFRLLEKRDFRRAPWIYRLFHSRPLKSNQKLHVTAEMEKRLLDELDKLKLKNEENLTFEDCLQPLFITLTFMTEEMDYIDHELSSRKRQHNLLKLFRQLLTLIIDRSAVFLQHAQEQERMLGPKEHYRALTNYWVYLIIGTILKDSEDQIPQFSPQAYAYSFLYPYSDDLLDRRDVDPSRKRALVGNIATKIKRGDTPEQLAFQDCSDDELRERRIYDLIDEALGPSKSQAVRESFAVINHAQLASIQQQVDFDDMRSGVKSLSKEFKQRIFDITVNKGVASVMPNTQFDCPPSLIKEQAELVAIIGYMGQFINDIEGLFEDLENKSLTPALICLLKYGTLDRFIEKCLTHIKMLLLRAPRQFPCLSQDRVYLLFRVLEFRLLVAAASLHEDSSGAILSTKFVRGVHEKLGVPMSFLALVGRLEKELFGNTQDLRAEPHHLSSPSEFRAFVMEQTEEWMKSPQLRDLRNS